MNAELKSRPVMRGSAIWTAIAVFVCLLPTLKMAKADGLVVLRDRQRIEGHIATDEDRDSLVWQASGFLDPFDIPLVNIKSISWRAPDEEPDAETFAVETNDGDLITGDITEINQSDIRLKSRSLGELTLPMSRVVRVTRLVDNPTLVFPHLSGLKDWTSPASENSGWKEDGNELVSDSPDSTLWGDLDVPERAIFEIEISWVGTPNFHLSLGCDANVSPDQSAGWSITCIGKTLAVFREREQTADLDILQMLDDDSSVRLTAFVDQRRDEISVYGTDGSLLGQLKSDDQPGDESDLQSVGSGVLLTNRDGTTKLRRLRIAEWIGKESSGTPSDTPFTVVMTNSEVIAAKTVAVEDGSDGIAIDSDGDNAASYPLSSLAGISVNENALATPDAPSEDSEEAPKNDQEQGDAKFSDEESAPVSELATVLLHDGARFTGELNSISAKSMSLRHRSTSQSVTVDRSAVQHILWQNADWQQTPADLLRLVATSTTNSTTSGGQLVMLGQLRPSQTGDSKGLASLSWQPHGSQSAARFEDGVSAKISFPEVSQKPDEKRSAKADTAEASNRRIREQIEAFRKAKLNRQSNDEDEEGSADVTSPPVEAEDESATVTYENNLFLRSGDQFICNVLGSGDQGVLVKPREGQQQVVPHEMIKAVEMGINVRTIDVEQVKRQRLLTLPRLQKDSPPSHLLVANNGDMLRCRILRMDAESIHIEIRLEEVSVARDRISHIIWLHPEDLLDDASDDEEADANPNADENALVADQVKANGELFAGYVQAIMRADENRLTFQPSRLEDNVIHGVHEVFGICKVALSDVSEIVLGSQIDATKRQDAYQDWVLTPAKEPLVAAAIRGEMPVPSHPLNGQRAPEVNLPLLDGDRYRLSRHRGEIVVLDFWASWCAPCMQTMPKVDELIAEFDPKRVTLLTINVSDGDAQIRRSLKRLNIRPEVALDIDGVVSERYQANAIPQLVVIDPKGEIKTVFVGGGDVVVARLRETIQELLDQ